MSINELNFFLELESRVWDALVSGDIKADESLLADNFLGVYSSGTAGKADHSSQLQDGPTIADYSLSDAKIMILAEDLVLLTYLAHFTRKKKNSLREGMYITSIWQRRGEEWLNIFSQDTKAEI